MKMLDASEELIMHRFGNGIKLIRPDQIVNERKNPYFGYNTGQTVGSILQLPMCVYFGNTESEGVNINDKMVEIAGFKSRHHAIGRTLRAVYSRKTADFINQNNKKIMESNKIKILDEEATRLKDNKYLSGISIKMPWYDNENKIIGLFGFSILIGHQSLADSLSHIAKFGFLNLNNQSNFLPGSYIHDIYLSKRETECLHLTIRGQSAKQIAQRIGISQRTVEEYLNNLKVKFSVSSKAELIDKMINYLMLNNFDMHC